LEKHLDETTLFTVFSKLENQVRTEGIT